jgi:hypothetical protein
MSTTRAPAAGVFGPYAAEKTLLAADAELAFCLRCREHGRKTALVQSIDAIGNVRDRCPVCDGVRRKPARRNPNEVLRPQALIGKAQLLPPCPPGVLRCQSCAHPVVGDARLCPKCELPGLSRKEIAAAHRAREDRELAARPPRPAPTMPRAMYPERPRTASTSTPQPATPAKAATPPDLARAVAQAERGERKQAPFYGARAPKVRTCLNCGRTSPLLAGRRELKHCAECRPAGLQPKTCAKCGTMFQPTGPAAKYCEAHQ